MPDDSTATATAPAASEAAATVLERADALAACTEEPGRLTRRFATPALARAGDLVLGWMRAAGMAAGRDAIGNVAGRWAPPGLPAGAPTLLLGSHLDTVRDAGRYDGMLGVLVALAVVEGARERDGGLPFAIEVLGFADEEGVRYGTAYLGSSVVAGTFDRSALDRRDADGIAMADAIAAFGGDPAALGAARRDPTDLLGYVEVHIEQGPVLEAEDLPVGVVTGIRASARAEIVFTGFAGHAGTVPMARAATPSRRAAEWIGAVEARGGAVDGLVATVGELDGRPGREQRHPGPRGAEPRRPPPRRRGPRGRGRRPARPRGGDRRRARPARRWDGGADDARRRVLGRADARARDRRRRRGRARRAPAERRGPRRARSWRGSAPSRCCSCGARAASATTRPRPSRPPTSRSRSTCTPPRRRRWPASDERAGPR